MTRARVLGLFALAAMGWSALVASTAAAITVLLALSGTATADRGLILLCEIAVGG